MGTGFNHSMVSLRCQFTARANRHGKESLRITRVSIRVEIGYGGVGESGNTEEGSEMMGRKEKLNAWLWSLIFERDRFHRLGAKNPAKNKANRAWRRKSKAEVKEGVPE